MNLIDLHNQLRTEAEKQADDSGPHYTLRVEISNWGSGPKMKYACYMVPNHKCWNEFHTPEALLASIRGESPEPDDLLNATPDQVLSA